MSEMNDYSGPFRPDLTFNDFSKEFLLKLMQVWQYAWLHMTEAWYEAVNKRFGTAAADDCEAEAWTTIGERVNPRYAKVANIQLNTVLDSLKALQLPLDNTIGGLFPVEYEIRTPNDVVQTVRQCRTLEYFEQSRPERIDWMCRQCGQGIIKKYLINPRIDVIPMKLPPRESPDEIACQWQFKLS